MSLRKSGFDLIVLGGGISGLAGAVQASLQGLRVALVEAGLPGGLLVNVGNIDGYPAVHPTSGAELASALLARFTEVGGPSGNQFVQAQVEHVETAGRGMKVRTNTGELRGKYVLCALGAELDPLRVPGAERLWQRGVSQCAFCDAGLYRGRTVVVVGGGDAALQEALHLTGHAAEVVLVHRGSRLRAQRHYVTRAAEADNMRFRWRTEVLEVLGSEGVEGVRVRHGGREEEETLACAAVFPFLGLRPNSHCLPPGVERDERGAVLTDALGQSTVPGLFAVGAVRAGYHGQVVNALSEASVAARAIAALG